MGLISAKNSMHDGTIDTREKLKHLSNESSLKNEENEWLRSKEAAIYLGISEAVLRNMTSNGSIPYYKLGRLNRYRRVELKQLLLSNKRGANHGN